MFLVTRADRIIVMQSQPSQMKRKILHSCGQFIFRYCHPAVGFRKYYIMDKAYHHFTGCQNGCINYEQFKWVVCFESQEKEKVEVDGAVVADDIIANFLAQLLVVCE